MTLNLQSADVTPDLPVVTLEIIAEQWISALLTQGVRYNPDLIESRPLVCGEFRGKVIFNAARKDRGVSKAA